MKQHRDEQGRFAKYERPVNRPTLVTILGIECLRAGVVMDDHGDEVSIRSKDGTVNERLTLRDACALLGMMNGVYCSPHVLKFGGIRIIPAKP